MYELIYLIFKYYSMLFVPFDNPGRVNQSRDKHSGFTFGFFYLFGLSLLMLVLNQIVIGGLNLSNIPMKTFFRYQFWRIFTAPFGTLDGFIGVLSVLLSFWWFIGLIPEKRYSTAHLLIQVFLQNFIVQIGYSLIVVMLVRGGTVIQTYNNYFFNLGWIPIVIIWLFKFSADEPEKKVNFCFLPFNIQKKYLSWICSLLLIIMTTQRAALIIAVLFGFIQYGLIGGSLIRLPSCFTRILQRLIPPFFRNMNCFITIQEAAENLKTLQNERAAAKDNIEQNIQIQISQDSLKANNTHSQQAKEIQRLKGQLKNAKKLSKKENEEPFEEQFPDLKDDEERTVEKKDLLVDM